MFGQGGRVAGRLDVGQHFADVRLVHPIGAAALFGGGYADMDVGAQRLGDLGAQVLADRATREEAEHLAEDETEGGHVVALRGARLPPRFGGGEPLAHKIPVGDVLPAHPGARPDHPRSVTHHHGQGDGLLACLTEFGPIAGHRRVQVDFTAVGELVYTGARQALGRGTARSPACLDATAECRRRQPSRPTD